MIQWEEWGAEAFARASREGKPVLLSLTAAWCRACHEMDRTTYADPAVAALVAARFVPVRVDTDRRPDINERYNLGGWPTTAFLTADGQLITGGTFVAADRMAAVLTRVVEAFVSRAAEWTAEHGQSAADLTERADHGQGAADLTERADHGQGAADLAERADRGQVAADLAERADQGQGAAELTESADQGQGAADLAERADRGQVAADLTEGADHGQAAADLTEDADDQESGGLIEAIFSTFDERYGGFGVEPKFPLVAPIALALSLFRESGEPRWRAIVETTLDAMWDGALWDAAAGGFHRYAVTRDWQQPHVEKLLETNAALLAVYAEASAVLGRPADRDRTAAIARFVTGTLRDARGGYFGSDAERTLYADGNGVAASSLLVAAAVLGDAALAREALASFERVLLACYKPGEGVAHQPGGIRGLLGDQIATVTALLDAHDLTGGEPYQMMAEEIGHYIVRVLADEAAGGLFDRVAQPDDVGLLRLRHKPFAGNAEAAIALSRLQRISRAYDFSAAAAGALLTAARQAPRQGPLAAHYVLAARQLR